MRKGIIAMLMAWALLGCMGMRASAAKIPDLSRKGTIRITMGHEAVKVPGGSMTIYRTGEIREDNGDYSFALTEDFLGSGIELENIHSEKLAGELARFAVKEEISGTTEKIDENGQVTFEELDPGLYLLVQNEAATGYQKISPFLVSLPGVADGEYVYEVDASPKVGELIQKESAVPPSTKPADPTLPQTGQLNWPVAVMASAGLALLATGLALRRRK